MRILVPVFFKAPLGGLHSHVYAQARAITQEGWHCTILCKPGPFAQQCRDGGFHVIEDDFKDLSASAAYVAQSHKFDIVHAHPFASREVGQGIAKILNIPIMITIHGKYTDSLEEGCEDYGRIYCVSPGVRDHLVKEGVRDLHKILIYPNAVNHEVFHGGASKRSDRVKTIRSSFQGSISESDRIIVFACRMGPDKKFILRCVMNSWKNQAKRKLDSWQWLVAGDGPAKAQLELAANELNERVGRKCIQFLGWQSEDDLNTLYQSADLVVAPGRSALDCLGCSRPVIAIGSKGYIGLIDEDNWYKGSYSNFGGVGEKEYTAGQLFKDINSIIYDDVRLADLGNFGKKQIYNFYDQKYWDGWLINQYREVFARHKKAFV
ncbi:glycosyltransferase family 4 protein [uncultured Microbulbifer sp.]|uniref:glycosyltransferase family 4 protein n=1 Tax=uncultured Microbulbifer sp. TaxID=348147 RepID=UPI00263219CD|nr:glycosyltransferase family 4 protein [uncultured Microbulbifer sp.]